MASRSASSLASKESYPQVAACPPPLAKRKAPPVRPTRSSQLLQKKRQAEAEAAAKKTVKKKGSAANVKKGKGDVDAKAVAAQLDKSTRHIAEARELLANISGPRTASEEETDDLTDAERELLAEVEKFERDFENYEEEAFDFGPPDEEYINLDDINDAEFFNFEKLMKEAQDEVAQEYAEAAREREAQAAIAANPIQAQIQRSQKNIEEARKLLESLNEPSTSQAQPQPKKATGKCPPKKTATKKPAASRVCPPKKTTAPCPRRPPSAPVCPPRTRTPVAPVQGPRPGVCPKRAAGPPVCPKRPAGPPVCPKRPAAPPVCPAPQPRAPSPVCPPRSPDDFEAMERQIAEEMRQQGLDPNAKPCVPVQEEEEEEEDDDFEAMERQIEEDMRRQGLDPHAKQICPQALELAEGIDSEVFEDVASRSLERSDGDWKSGAQFFKEDDERYLAQLSPAAQQRYLHPYDEYGQIDESQDFIPEVDIIDEALSPGDVNNEIQAVAKLYYDYNKDNPALHGDVPVTTPRPSVLPMRPSGRIVDYSPPTAVKIKADARRSPVKYPPVPFPPSPPRTPQELAHIPTTPTHYIQGIPPEAYQFQYESPPTPDYQKLQKVPAVDNADISPRRRDWYSHHMAPYLNKTKEVPDVFDLPPDRLMAEGLPCDFAPAVSPDATPINLAQLKRDIAQKYKQPDVGGYSAYLRNMEKEQKMPVARRQYATAIDLMHPIREKNILADFEKFFMPDEYAANNDATPPLRSPPFVCPPEGDGGLEAVTPPLLEDLNESRELTEQMECSLWDEQSPSSPTSPQQYGAFDFAHMAEHLGAVTPPRDIYGLPSPPTSPSPLDAEEFKRTVCERAQRGKGDLREFGRAPKLHSHTEGVEYLTPERRHMYEKSQNAQQLWPTPKDPFPQSKRSELSPIGSPVEYPDSPTTRTVAPPSPSGRQGAQRRTLRKQLKKRKLQFDEDAEVCTETVEAHIERDFGPDLNLPDDLVQAIRQSLGVRASPPKADASPRTPRQLDILEEQMPDVCLPQESPPSPFSQYGVLEGFVDEIKQHRPVQGGQGRGFHKRSSYKRPEVVTKAPKDLRTRSRDFYKTHPWRQLEEVEECPIDEAAYRLHEQLEAEVEAEMQKAQQKVPASLLDEPLPEGLRSPLRVEPTVPFYTTPPHLKMQPMPQLRIKRKKKTEDEEMEEFLRLEGATVGAAGLQRERSPGYCPGARDEVYARADAQYAALMGTPPPKVKTPRRKRLPLPDTMEGLMAYHRDMPPSPGFLKQRAELEAAERQAAQKGPKGVKADAKGAKLTKKSSEKCFYDPKTGRRMKASEVTERKPEEAKSDRSVKSRASDRSIKSSKSDQSIKKRKKKKYNVASKIDTGKKKAAEAKYDVAALQDLGISQTDLDNIQVLEPQAACPQVDPSSPQAYVEECYDPRSDTRQTSLTIKGTVSPGEDKRHQRRVQDEAAACPRSPTLFDEAAPWDADTSFMEVVAADGCLEDNELAALDEVETSFGQGGGLDDDFGWMSPTKYEGKWPWEE